jgi:hypothetical protein
MKLVFTPIEPENLESVLNTAVYKNNASLRAYSVIVSWLALNRQRTDLRTFQENIKQELDNHKYLPCLKSSNRKVPLVLNHQLIIYSKNLTMYD